MGVVRIIVTPAVTWKRSRDFPPHGDYILLRLVYKIPRGIYVTFAETRILGRTRFNDIEKLIYLFQRWWAFGAFTSILFHKDCAGRELRDFNVRASPITNDSLVADDADDIIYIARRIISREHRVVWNRACFSA